jgi:ABC-type antimicrobial peptide transport system permease subunit
MYEIDEFRLSKLRVLGIEDEDLDNYHETGKEKLNAAKKAFEEKKYDEYIKNVRDGLSSEVRTYPAIKKTANDTVRGIIFYFALILPFSLFLERLIFGFPDIRKQLAGFFGIFLLIFFILRYIHPAFMISTSPYIIFLAFIILILAVFVSALIISKFNYIMQQIRKKAARDHEVDVNRISASTTAFSLGISNLRKRPARTIMTITTIVLLTFSVLSFTSVKNTTSIFKLNRVNRTTYFGGLIRNVNWMPLFPRLKDYCEATFKKQGAKVASRYWFLSNVYGDNYSIELQNKKNEIPEPPRVFALVGLPENEDEITNINKYLEEGRFPKNNEKKAIALSKSIVNSLKLDIANTDNNKVTMLGNDFTLVGVVKETISEYRDLDDEGLTPAVFYGVKSETQSEQMSPKSISVFDHMPAYNVVFCSQEFVRGIGGDLRSIAIRFPEKGFSKYIEDFLTRVGLTIFVGEQERVQVFSSFGTTQIGGFGNVIILILIAALIILNTMLGSVYERYREIGVYSSVGLAPMHIASLFIAEACVYAVMGAIGGYLLGQIVSKIIVEYGVFKDLSLNYSSFAAIFSTIIVMITVLLSTIYPAKKASKMAVPDVTRKWKFPEPEGDKWNFEFPFTIAGREVLGINTFLWNYFDSYTDESIGNIHIQNIVFKNDKDENGNVYHLEMDMWLAPYDLGVAQHVEFKTTLAMKEQNIYAVFVSILRNDGDQNNWKKLNKGFLTILRKQFLIWRTVPAKVKEEFENEGKKYLEGKISKIFEEIKE